METEEKEERAGRLWGNYQRSRLVEERDALIVHYLFLVKFAVGRIGAGLPTHIKMEDLYSSGVTGLIKAVERFDPTKNSKFESYAILLIKGAIIDELRELDWVPRSVHQKAHWITEGQQLLQNTLGREPTDQELAKHLGIEEEALGELFSRIRPAVVFSLDADSHSHSLEEEGLQLVEKIADLRAETSYTIADRNEWGLLLAQAIDGLPEQERKVLHLYYYEELMLKEIGKVLGVSESRVSQIHTKALLKLRRYLTTLIP